MHEQITAHRACRTVSAMKSSVRYRGTGGAWRRHGVEMGSESTEASVPGKERK
jgi:hypothetical protein